MSRARLRIWWAAVVLLPGPLLWGVRQLEPPPAGKAAAPPAQIPIENGMARLPGGSFAMGSLEAAPDDQRPVHRVVLAPFALGVHPTTNRQFAEFVAATKYRTTAEMRGSSLVFDPALGDWQEVTGACWQHPRGPNDSLVGKEAYPVVHVSWFDAVAYAAWADKRLPTEAEFEYAARAGLADCKYPWGRELAPGNRLLANFWQGNDSQQDSGLDGHAGLAPVGAYPPNRWGLADMVGNVWCWCADWYAPDAYGQSLPRNPTGPTSGVERVRRGGCWLSPAPFNSELEVSHRDHAPPEQTSNHTGFRCARSD